MSILKRLFPSYTSNWKLLLCPFVGVGIGCTLAPRLVNLMPPPAPPIGIDRHEPGLRAQVMKVGQLVSGSGSTPFLVVEVSDYFCPACRESEDKIAGQLANMKSVSRMVVHFPFHPGAREAAIASLEADKFGVGPDFHHILMSFPSTGWKPFLDQIVKSKSLSYDQLRHDQPEAEERLKGNLAIVSKLAIKATPSFFVCDQNGNVFQAYNSAGVITYLRNSGA